MMDEVDYVKLGPTCADVCTALGRVLKDLDNSAGEAIIQLTT